MFYEFFIKFPFCFWYLAVFYSAAALKVIPSFNCCPLCFYLESQQGCSCVLFVYN